MAVIVGQIAHQIVAARNARVTVEIVPGIAIARVVVAGGIDAP